MDQDSELGFSTRALHAGHQEDAVGALTPPLYQTSTYVQDAVGELRAGYDYSRAGNPTRALLEERLAALEGAAHGVAFASGMAAVETIMHFLPEEAHVVCVADVYGGVFRLFDRVYQPRGYRFSYLSPEEMSTNLAAHLDGVHLVWLETPTNPLLGLVDLAAAVESVKAARSTDAGPLVVVDNTFATPYLQRPLEYGVDLVVHSTSKYIGGHADLVGGFVATDDPIFAERLRFLQKTVGAVPSPFDCWLALRGLKTLALRMERHSANAAQIADFLTGHARVKHVLYPGLESHPGHDIAKAQMAGYGGMVSLLLESEQEAVRLCEATRVFTLAESLGGVESLIEHPYRMTHASSAAGPIAVPRELVRLSVGIEDIEDLVQDLEQALG